MIMSFEKFRELWKMQTSFPLGRKKTTEHKLKFKLIILKRSCSSMIKCAESRLWHFSKNTKSNFNRANTKFCKIKPSGYSIRAHVCTCGLDVHIFPCKFCHESNPMEWGFLVSLQLKIDTEESWDIAGAEEVTMHDAVINMSEEDDFWKFIKAQADIFLGKFVNCKASNDTLIDQYRDTVLW